MADIKAISKLNLNGIDYAFSPINTITKVRMLYYVDGTNGLDTNPGTISSPFKTLDKAMSVIKLHNEYSVSIHIKTAGTYRFNISQINNIMLIVSADVAGITVEWYNGLDEIDEAQYAFIFLSSYIHIVGHPTSKTTIKFIDNHGKESNHEVFMSLSKIRIENCILTGSNIADISYNSGDFYINKSEISLPTKSYQSNLIFDTCTFKCRSSIATGTDAMIKSNISDIITFYGNVFDVDSSFPFDYMISMSGGIMNIRGNHSVQGTIPKGFLFAYACMLYGSNAEVKKFTESFSTNNRLVENVINGTFK